MRKATKIFISFAVVLIAGLNFIVPAFAQDPFSSISIGGLGGASGAGLFSSMAGMSGIDVNWQSGGADPLDAMWNVLNPDHVYFSGEKHEADPQAYPEDVWDYITVDIGDWLDAQSDFIVNFAQTYSVDDNDSGTVNISPNYGGYSFTNNVIVQSTSCLRGVSIGTVHDGAFYQIGNTYISFTYTGNSISCTIKYTDGTINNISLAQNFAGKDVFLACNRTNPNSVGWIYPYMGNYYWFDSRSTATINQASTVPWTSSTVNTNVFDGWESAKVKIPHSISGLTPGWTIPDFTNALNNLWANGQQGQIVIEDTDQPVPPPPVPTTPLGDVPFDDWIDLWGQGIYQQLENQSDALDFIGSNGTDAIEELESIDENIGALEEAAESIDTNIGIGNGILGGIESLAQEAVDFLEGIAEHVGELVEEIVEGTETLIAGILNQIPPAFSVIFGPIKQASSIWHYVVEWIQSIGAPFQFIWSMASGTSYYMILPVYASLAAAVVLAFFKRFGR